MKIRRHRRQIPMYCSAKVSPLLYVFVYGDMIRVVRINFHICLQFDVLR